MWLTIYNVVKEILEMLYLLAGVGLLIGVFIALNNLIY